MQLAGVRFNLWHKLHHLSTAQYLFWPQDRGLFFPSRYLWTHPTQQEIVRKRPWRITAWLSIWIHTNCHEAHCVFDSYYVAFMLLSSKWTVSHIYGTPPYHTLAPRRLNYTRSVSVASTLLSLSVFWLQALSIYSFKSSGHLLDLWWWRLWPWDLSAPQRNKVSYREREKQKPFPLRFLANHCHAVNSVRLFSAWLHF